MRKLVLALLLFVMAGVLVSDTAGTDGELLANLVAARFGVPRQYDSTLDNLAQREAERVAAQGAMEHVQLTELTSVGWAYGDVQARNRYAGDPLAYAIDGWAGSPGHAVILSSPFYPRIGCGHTGPVPNTVDGWHYLVCIVGKPPDAAPAPIAPPPVLPPAPSLPPPVIVVPGVSIPPAPTPLPMCGPSTRRIPKAAIQPAGPVPGPAAQLLVI